MRCSPIPRRYRNVVLTVLATGLLAGCTTAAQRQYQAISTNNQAVLAQARACATEIYNSPDAAPLRAHVPLNPTEATIQQLSDPAPPTAAEIAAINALYPRLKACQSAI